MGAGHNRIAHRKRDGATLTYAYDSLNRMIHKRIPDPNGGPAAGASANCYTFASDGNDVCYGYDLRGLQTFARFGSAAGTGITNVYDGLGRLTTSTTNMGGISRTLAYGHDLNGNRISLTHPRRPIFHLCL